MPTMLDRLSVLGCILLILSPPLGGLAASAADEAPDQVLRAGAAAADITPPLGERVIGGFEPFPSTAIHDNLYARCLVLDNGEAQIAFVICDNLGIIRDVFDEARQRIAKETELPPLKILMAATHTHSGPTCLPCTRRRLHPKSFGRNDCREFNLEPTPFDVSSS
jgi:hypothetical protein